MSSNNSYIQNTNTSQSLILDEINSLIKSNKTIIPFNQKHFSCHSLSLTKNLSYLDLASFNAVEEYCPQDQVITVQTGIKIKSLQKFLLMQGKWFPVSYYDDETSLLDLILSAETGPTELLLGGLSRHILGLESILGTGQLIKSGGKVVKNVSGYDLTRFFIGSYGYFALPIKAHIRICAIPAQNSTFLIQGDNSQQLLHVARQILNSNLPLACIELLNIRLIKTSTLEEKYKLQKQYVLAVQTYGCTAVVNKAKEIIENNLSENNLLYSIIDDPDKQHFILQELSQISWFTDKPAFPKEKKSKILDLSIKWDNLIQLLGDNEISSFPFVYRLASNRMRFCSDSVAEQTVLLNYLENFAQASQKTLSVAYGDDTYIRRVSKLGYDTVNGDPLLTIKKQLKTQYDPHNLLNPYVHL